MDFVAQHNLLVLPHALGSFRNRWQPVHVRRRGKRTNTVFSGTSDKGPHANTSEIGTTSLQGQNTSEIGTTSLQGQNTSEIGTTSLQGQNTSEIGTTSLQGQNCYPQSVPC